MAREFSIRDVLSVTTGVLLSEEGMRGVHRLLNYMVGDALIPGELATAADECKLYLYSQFPWLEDVPILGEAGHRRIEESVVEAFIAEHGEYHAVESIPPDARTPREFVAMEDYLGERNGVIPLGRGASLIPVPPELADRIIPELLRHIKKGRAERGETPEDTEEGRDLPFSWVSPPAAQGNSSPDFHPLGVLNNAIHEDCKACGLCTVLKSAVFLTIATGSAQGALKGLVDAPGWASIPAELKERFANAMDTLVALRNTFGQLSIDILGAINLGLLPQAVKPEELVQRKGGSEGGGDE